MNNRKMVYKIIEIANTHGGDINYVMEIIEVFKEYNACYGIKFQPLHADQIATSDYEWYPVYKELFFEPGQWEKIIKEASKTKDVWLDMFDNYGVQILQSNLDMVYGIKFQSSVLFNYSLIEALSKVDLSKKELILNVSAYNVEEIRNLLGRIETKLLPKEILLEIGFQAYPTSLEDCGISKIKC
jgi:sialic acid synthase SpsE